MGIARETAAQYSFLAAVPVMFAATVLDLYKSLPILQGSDVMIFAIGFVVSFMAAWSAIKFFLRFLGHHTLNPFGWYRIIIALGILWFNSGSKGRADPHRYMSKGFVAVNLAHHGMGSP